MGGRYPRPLHRPTGKEPDRSIQLHSPSGALPESGPDHRHPDRSSCRRSRGELVDGGFDSFEAAVDASRVIREVKQMSALLRIESEVAGLPPQDQKSLLAWLQNRLAVVPDPIKEAPESLEVFRELQREIALTPTAATVWKSAVKDGRR